MAAYLIPLLMFLAVMSVGGGILAYRSDRKERIRNRLAPMGESLLPPSGAGLTEVLGTVGGAVSSGKTSRTLQQGLARAGYYSSTAPAIYLGLKVLLAAAVLVLSMAVAAPSSLGQSLKVAIVITMAGGAFFLPNMLVHYRQQRRTLDVRHHLPDAVDLLEICVSSGIGLDMAWNLVTDEIRPVSRVLSDEMALTNLEIHLGATRLLAMRHMGERTGADELTSLVAVLIQSERFGTSVSDALRVLATSMREARTALAEETAEKMAVKLLFPMVILIFPAMLIVVAGPAIIKLMELMAYD